MRIEPRRTNALKASAVSAVLRIIRSAVLRNPTNLLRLTHEDPKIRSNFRDQLHKGMELGVDQSIRLLKKKYPEIKILKEIDESFNRVVDRVIEEYLKEHGSGSMRLDERPGFGLVSYRFQAIIAGKDLLADGKSAILYLHGGAFIVCSPITHSALCLYLSAEAGGIPIYSLDYPLSPEFHFPAALNCAAEAYRDLMNRGFTNIAIAGDSAGGNLVLALLLKLQELNLPAPKCAVAMSPWADLTHSGESIQTNAAIDPLLPKELLNTAAEFYVQDEKELLDPLVSPLFASKEQFEKFPPLALHVGAKEVLYDDSIRIAEKIGLDRTQLVVWEGMHHVFPLSVGTLEESDRAVHDIANFIIQHIHHHQNDENEEKEKENSSHTKE